MDELEAVRARVAAATPGPWQRHGSDVRAEGVGDLLFRGRDGSSDVRRQADADAEFVAHAREDVLRLLALVEERSPREAEDEDRGLSRA